jgi:hypothetical protein
VAPPGECLKARPAGLDGTKVLCRRTGSKVPLRQDGRFCPEPRFRHSVGGGDRNEEDAVKNWTVDDVMTKAVVSVDSAATCRDVVDVLTRHRFSAVLSGKVDRGGIA